MRPEIKAHRENQVTKEKPVTKVHRGNQVTKEKPATKAKLETKAQ